MNTIDPILFPLDETPPAANLVYRPWGTRTIKIKVTTNTEMPALRIRPNGVRAEDAAKGIYRAYADDSDAFIIGWGGGHEPGPCLKSKDFLAAFEKCQPMESGDSSMVYFNLTHVGTDVPDMATFTIEAYDEKTGTTQASLPIQVVKPDSLPANPARFEQGDDGRWLVTGDYLPTYDSRWWPTEFEYTDMPPEARKLKISTNGSVLTVARGRKEIATIIDHSKPTLMGTENVQYELFAFDEFNLALRIWFFWYDTTIGKGHEVPDAERFDLIIRKSDGAVIFACTDLHWREVWGEVKDADPSKGIKQPLAASIGLGKEVKKKLVEEGVNKLLGKSQGKDHETPYNPLDGFVKAQAKQLGDPSGSKRGKGWEAHVPDLGNITQSDEEKPSLLTSSDVRLG